MNRQPIPMLRSRNIIQAYALLRIIIGVNYFNHGFTRINNIPGFAQAMVELYQNKGILIPTPLIQINAFLVPPVEFIVGFLLIVGLFTRGALIATLLLMVVLMYGITLLQNWPTASSQLVYDLILALLLAGLGYNQISLDGWFAKRGRQPTDTIAGGAQDIVRFILGFLRFRPFLRR